MLTQKITGFPTGNQRGSVFMDYTYLFEDAGEKKSVVGIIGATKGYGYTLLAQIPKVKHMQLRVICSRHPDECREVLRETGFGDRKIVECVSEEEVKAAPEDAVLIVSDYSLVSVCGITALVEATGNTAIGCEAAEDALRKGINVYMVSKETDSVCGPRLNQIAKENHAVYALVNGDQPRNLVDLYSWAKALGLEIICAGKSSEYDFVWDRETGEFTYMDRSGTKEMIPELINCWRYQGRETLEARQKLLAKYTGSISADLCEMNLVSNITGLTPAQPKLSYPIAKPSELADIFIPEEDGGILKKTGVVDVFFNIRGIDEASFCGGEFVVIRCENEKMWEILIGKGHVVSRSRKYCCIYYPYHFMGMESPLTILLGDLKGLGTHPECRQVSVMAGVAEKDIPAGTVLKVSGHHHSIDGLEPELLELESSGNVAPFYLLNGVVLKNDIPKGRPVTVEDVDLEGQPAYRFYAEGLKL